MVNLIKEIQEIQGSEINFESMSTMPASQFDSDKYSEIIYDLNRSGVWSNFYRDAVDHLKNAIGKHQVKALRLVVNKENKDK